MTFGVCLGEPNKDVRVSSSNSKCHSELLVVNRHYFYDSSKKLSCIRLNSESVVWEREHANKRLPVYLLYQRARDDHERRLLKI